MLTSLSLFSNSRAFSYVADHQLLHYILQSVSSTSRDALTEIQSFCFCFRFDNDRKVIGLAHQRISEAYEACDPKLLVQQPSSLFKDFDENRKALSKSDRTERDAIDALRDLTGMKEHESEKTRLQREAALKQLEDKSAADQASWKQAEELEQKEKEGKEERKAREKKEKEEKERKDEKERQEKEERERQEEKEREEKEKERLAEPEHSSSSDDE